jgi:hypothetical protein
VIQLKNEQKIDSIDIALTVEAFLMSIKKPREHESGLL